MSPHGVPAVSPARDMSSLATVNAEKITIDVEKAGDVSYFDNTILLVPGRADQTSIVRADERCNPSSTTILLCPYLSALHNSPAFNGGSACLLAAI